MPSDRFTFICTKTTADFIVPVSAPSQQEFNRKVANAFKGLVGGVLRVGDLKDRPTEDPLPFHLLCDGSTIQRSQFPELVTYLAGATASEATLPNYAGAVEISTPTAPQTSEPGGTTTGLLPPIDYGGAGGTQGGNIPGGGRVTYNWEQFLPPPTSP